MNTSGLFMFSFFALISVNIGLAQEGFIEANTTKLLKLDSQSQRPIFGLSLIPPGAGLISIADPDRDLKPKFSIICDKKPIKPENFVLKPEGQSVGKRYVMILLDNSGSMLQKVASDKRKYQAAKDACRVFVGLSNSSDFIAIVPFTHLNVVEGVKSAAFLNKSAELNKAIDKIPTPIGAWDTGLYSAIDAALTRLEKMKLENSPDDQFFLIAMTDGKNDVRKARGLMTDWRMVKKMEGKIDIQTMCIGFGSGKNLATGILKLLSYPDPKSFCHARTDADLKKAFQLAKTFQLKKLNFYVMPEEATAIQLLHDKTFSINYALDPGDTIKGSFIWKRPLGVGTPTFDGIVPEGIRNKIGHKKELPFLFGFLLTVVILGSALCWLWVFFPKKKWRKEYLEGILYPRMMKLLKENEHQQ